MGCLTRVSIIHVIWEMLLMRGPNPLWPEPWGATNETRPPPRQCWETGPIPSLITMVRRHRHYLVMLVETSKSLAVDLLPVCQWYPRKHGAFNQCCFNAGPASKTVGQHWSGIWWMPCVWWDGRAYTDGVAQTCPSSLGFPKIDKYRVSFKVCTFSYVGPHTGPTFFEFSICHSSFTVD